MAGGRGICGRVLAPDRHVGAACAASGRAASANRVPVCSMIEDLLAIAFQPAHIAPVRDHGIPRNVALWAPHLPRRLPGRLPGSRHAPDRPGRYTRRNRASVGSLVAGSRFVTSATPPDRRDEHPRRAPADADVGPAVNRRIDSVTVRGRLFRGDGGSRHRALHSRESHLTGDHDGPQRLTAQRRSCRRCGCWRGLHRPWRLRGTGRRVAGVRPACRRSGVVAIAIGHLGRGHGRSVIRFRGGDD